MKRYEKKNVISLFPLSNCSVVLTACDDNSPEQTKPDEKSEDQTDERTAPPDRVTSSGGTLKIVYKVEPPTLDLTIITAGATKDFARHIYESLVTLDQDGSIVPQLAESYETSLDGKVKTFHLRKGVLFHNGKEMTAEDVVVSMNKWSDHSAVAKTLLADAEWVLDDYTVELHQEQLSYLVFQALADQNQLAAIMPKEIAEADDGTGV